MGVTLFGKGSHTKEHQKTNFLLMAIGGLIGRDVTGQGWTCSPSYIFTPLHPALDRHAYDINDITLNQCTCVCHFTCDCLTLHRV